MTTALITSIGGALAGMVAGALAAQPGVRVIGVDTAPPEIAPPGVETRVLAPDQVALAELLRSTEPDVVVHMAPAGEATALDHALTATTLLGACAATGVRRVVLRSSTLVYGARHDLPAFVDEATPLGRAGVTGVLRDYAEGERRAAELKESGPKVTILRCAPLVGGRVATPLARYLAQPMPYTLLGFNPRIQVLHPDDAVIAFALAALVDDLAGPFNIAADPPLTIAQAIRLAGRQPVPLPNGLLGMAAWPGPAQAAATFPFDIAFLRYPCIADTRRARERLGWAAQHPAEEALREVTSSG
jgi:UDP-glucose 4-epimerase